MVISCGYKCVILDLPGASETPGRFVSRIYVALAATAAAARSAITLTQARLQAERALFPNA
jgi:hypothetical protein